MPLHRFVSNGIGQDGMEWMGRTGQMLYAIPNAMTPQKSLDISQYNNVTN